MRAFSLFAVPAIPVLTMKCLVCFKLIEMHLQFQEQNLFLNAFKSYKSVLIAAIISSLTLMSWTALFLPFKQLEQLCECM